MNAPTTTANAMTLVQKQDRIKELMDHILTGKASPADKKEVIKLGDEIESEITNRAKEVGALKGSFSKVSATLHEVFGDDLVSMITSSLSFPTLFDAYMAKDEGIVSTHLNNSGFSKGGRPPKTPKKGTTTKVEKKFPSDANESLIHIPVFDTDGPRTAVFDYKKGRIYEAYAKGMDQNGPGSKEIYTLGTAFPKKLLKFGVSVDALKPHFTTKGAEYFATKAGEKELADIVAYVNKKKPSVDKAIADAKAKASKKS
jgi:hypothetical protein